MLLGAVAGLLTARRTLFGHLVFLAMAAVALLAAMTRPDFTPYPLLPLAVGVVVWIVLLDYLTGTAQARAPSLVASRRRFLLSAGGVARRRARRRRSAAGFVGPVARAVEAARAAAAAAGHAVAPCLRARTPAPADWARGGCRTTTSTGSTPRWWCRPSTRPTGGCASTAWSTGRSR